MLIRGVEITTANIHDAAELEATCRTLPALSTATVSIKAAGQSGSSALAMTLRGWCTTSTWAGPDVLERLQEHSADVRRIRCRIAKALRTCKRSYGLRRMRWLRLAKAGLQVRLAAMA